MANPNTRETLKQYALRNLGKPVIEINASDEQLEDRIDEALQYYAQYHYDGIRRTYLKYQLTEDDKTRLKNPNRSSESTTDKKESGVSTTWSEQDNYLVIPESIISRLEKSPDPIDEGISIAAEQVKSFLGIAQGVHLMAVKAEQQIPLILDKANVS